MSAQDSAADVGRWAWDWFDNSPNGPTYGVRCANKVVCYTNRFKKGYEDAKRIADEHNAAEQSAE